VIKQEAYPEKESKRPKTSEEAGFELAISKPRIISEPVETLKEALRQIFFLIGLRAEQIPADEEKVFLIQYIAENYGGHTADELKLAFKMAIQGRLKIDNKEVKCYGIFSPMYFTTIMDAYRDWAREQIKLLPMPIEDRKLNPMEVVHINLIWALKCLNEINKLPVKVVF
jgi:hypothetical protein